jgi:glycosyltransferase involved in cell wall biosynthesis
LESISHQVGAKFEVIISQDHAPGNANLARNQGALLARGDYLLFSDDDIGWYPGALVLLRETLRQHPTASFSYGAYRMDERIYCAQHYSLGLLRRRNYISTMSLIRKKDFPGFDESIQRLQDYDLWLTMAARGRYGVYCGNAIFSTERRSGITFGGNVSWRVAAETVWKKHGIAHRGAF